MKTASSEEIVSLGDGSRPPIPTCPDYRALVVFLFLVGAVGIGVVVWLWALIPAPAGAATLKVESVIVVNANADIVEGSSGNLLLMVPAKRRDKAMIEFAQLRTAERSRLSLPLECGTVELTSLGEGRYAGIVRRW
jgi:hypothetical protein